jgi:hypothetical protein
MVLDGLVLGKRQPKVQLVELNADYSIQSHTKHMPFQNTVMDDL